MSSSDDYKNRIRNACAKGEARQLKKLGFGKKTRTNAHPEKEVEKACLELMRTWGWSVEIYEAKATYDPAKGIYRQQAMKAGTVDCMGATEDGISAIVEFKAPGKLSTLSPDQHDFITEKINANCFACVIDSPKLLNDIYSHWKSLRQIGQTMEAKAFLFSKLPPRKEQNIGGEYVW